MKDNSNLEFRKIKSLKFLYEINENGTILRNIKSKKQIKIKLDFHHSKKGYYVAFVHIGGRRPDAKTVRVMIHKAVAECWLGDCPQNMEVDHIDRNPHNNNYRNLRYVNHSEQMKNRQLSPKIINQATQNCLNYSLNKLAVKVKINGLNEQKEFKSMAQCAQYLSKKYNKTLRQIDWKLSDRRKHIYDYDIEYFECRD